MSHNHSRTANTDGIEQPSPNTTSSPSLTAEDIQVIDRWSCPDLNETHRDATEIEKQRGELLWEVLEAETGIELNRIIQISNEIGSLFALTHETTETLKSHLDGVGPTIAEQLLIEDRPQFTPDGWTTTTQHSSGVVAYEHGISETEVSIERTSPLTYRVLLSPDSHSSQHAVALTPPEGTLAPSAFKIADVAINFVEEHGGYCHHCDQSGLKDHLSL